MHDRAIWMLPAVLVAVLVVTPCREALGLPIAAPPPAAPAGADGDKKAAAVLPQEAQGLVLHKGREVVRAHQRLQQPLHGGLAANKPRAGILS